MSEPDVAVAGEAAAMHSLDELTAWCGNVLRRASEGPDAAIRSRPPLPEGLHGPLARHGFDRFDEVALALTLAPDLDPLLGVSMADLIGVRGSHYPTLALIADLVQARGSERTALASRLSVNGPLSEIGLVHIVPPSDAPVQADPPRGPSLLDSCVASTALLRWVFGITQLDPALFPLVRDDLTAPSAPPDLTTAEALAARMAGESPTVTALVGERPADALATALWAAARSERPVLVVDAVALVDTPSATRVAAEAMLREAAVIVTGALDQVLPRRWETFVDAIAIGAEPEVATYTGHDCTTFFLQPTEGAVLDVTSHVGHRRGKRSV